MRKIASAAHALYPAHNLRPHGVLATANGIDRARHDLTVFARLVDVRALVRELDDIVAVRGRHVLRRA